MNYVCFLDVMYTIWIMYAIITFSYRQASMFFFSYRLDNSHFVPIVMKAKWITDGHLHNEWLAPLSGTLTCCVHSLEELLDLQNGALIFVSSDDVMNVLWTTFVGI